MVITNITYCGKKEAGGYSRVKVWSNEVANDLQVGHHRPTIEQLNAKGWMVYVDTAYDSATEKLADIYTDDGSIISKDKVSLTPEDIELIISAKISRLELEIDAVCAEHVACHIDLTEKAHWMGMADAIARKQSLWIGDQLGGNPDLESFPQPTPDEYILWSNLATIQKLTANCRDAATVIANSLYLMATEEINVLPADWVTTHNSWP